MDNSVSFSPKDNEKKPLTAVIILVLFCIGLLVFFAFLPIFMQDSDKVDEAMYVVAQARTRTDGSLKVYPYHDDTSGKFYFFLPGSEYASKYTLFLNGFGSLQIGDEVYESGSEINSSLIADINKDEISEGVGISYTNKRGETFTETAYFLAAGEIGTLYISLGEDAIKKVDDDPLHSVSAVADYAIYDDCNHKEFGGKLKISGHGNSTWTELMEEFPGQEFKRSYNISVNEQKKSIMGMDPAGNFVLLSNFYDESEIKNYLALKTARKIGMENVPDCEYANLYINGRYRGLYLVTQRIKSGNGFLDISSDGYLAKFDYEERVKADGNIWFDTNSLYARLLTPTDIDDERLEEIKADVQKTEDAIIAGYDEFSKTADTDSFIAYYMMQEFFENGDADRASEYIYKRKDTDKLKAGPIWDFDLSMGHPWFNYDGEETSALWITGLVDERGWLRRLSNDEEFMAKIYDYYKSSFAHEVDDVTNKLLPETADRIENSWYMDMIRYDKGPVYYDKFDYEAHGCEKYDQSAIMGDIADWLVNRKEFWDGYTKDPTRYIKQTSEPGSDTKSIRRLIVLKKK